MGLFLGIDAGTSGMRACVIDEQAQPVAESALPLAPSTTEASHIEQQPQDWWQVCCELLDDLFSRIDPADISSLAIDGTSSTCLLCDRHGSPQSAALMYNDGRARQQADVLASLAGHDSAVASPSSSLAKLLWLVENGLLQADSHFCHQADWLTGHFLNNYRLTDENNALKLGFHAQSGQWPAWLAALKLPESVLPDVRPAGSLLGYVCEDMQVRFGLSASCRVVAGTTDSTAACLAAGVSQTGDAVTVLGSTLVVKILSSKPVFAPEFGVYSHRLGNAWLVGGASNSGGAILRQFFNDEQLASLSAGIDPMQDSGLHYYPLAAPGERFPVNDPDYPPRLMPRPNNDVQFLHGLLEGITHIEAQAYKKLSELGAPVPGSIRTIGGGAKNTTWQKMRERISGISMKPAIHEQAACGTAKLALQCDQEK